MNTTPEKKPAKRSSKIKIDPNNRIVIKGAREHNLKNVDLELPRDKLIVMTGLSGSGKSTLVNEILYKTLAAALNGARSCLLYTSPSPRD